MIYINPVELIRKKRNGGRLTDAEMEFFVAGYTRGDIPDYQVSSLLMAVYFRGLDPRETASLTRAMIRSGETFDLSDIRKPKLDKHSTGGVGDKVSLVLAPLIACCGICVPMISGRGLGHTGGTLDKLGSIPGFRTDLTAREFISQLKKISVAMIGQTEKIAPADRKIYALRDVTATVDSIPLICASIMSKKLAEGLDGLVLDVKFGSGAFMKEYGSAKILARTLVRTGKAAGIKVTAVLTDMNNPLGEYVGNSLEVMETIEALKSNGPADLMELTLVLGEEMLKMAKIKGGRRLLLDKIASGDALDKFRDVIRCQGGDTKVIADHSRLPMARKAAMIRARSNGYVHAIDNHRIGTALVRLGGGRSKKEDKIDPACGFKINKKIGDRVKKADILIDIYSNNRGKAAAVKELLKNTYTIKEKPCKHKRLIREIIY
ncbi:MAG TPA: thymidine phosphorylase [bacterium]